MEERSYHPIAEGDYQAEQAPILSSSSILIPFAAPDGLTISERVTPPAHYTLQIESFTLLRRMLARLRKVNYKSRIFEACGYKWKLSLYPAGNKKRNGEGFISMYLILADTDNLPLGLNINATFTFFVYDQIRDKYLSIQHSEGRVRRFHKTKTEHGVSQLISLTSFNNASNGYLVNDSCEFGVEVFVVEKPSKGECLKMFLEPDGDWYFTWDISNFSTLISANCYSVEFPGGGRSWKLRIHYLPREKHLSLFLCLICHSNNSNFMQMLIRKCTERFHGKNDINSDKGCKVYVECQLRVADQIHGKHVDKTVYGRFSDACSERGFPKFMLLSNIHNTSKGFLANDTLVVQAKFNIIYVTEDS